MSLITLIVIVRWMSKHTPLKPPEAPPLKSPDTPQPKKNAPRSVTDADFIHRVQINRHYAAGTLQWSVIERVNVITEFMLHSNKQVQKIIRDLNAVGTIHIKPTLDATRLLQLAIEDVEHELLRLRRTLPHLDPSVAYSTVENSLMPEDDPSEQNTMNKSSRKD